MIANWIKTKALFQGEIKPYLDQDKAPLEESDFTFDSNKIVAFNRASDDFNTTIWIEGHSTITVAIEYDKYIEKTR